MAKRLLCAACLALCASLFAPSVMAQGMVTEIKVFAVPDLKSLDTTGFDPDGAKDYRDFRKGRGGECVFVLFKNSTDTALYITDVKVETKTAFGIPFDSGDKKYMPAHFFQHDTHKDDKYKGGLNGRNYSVYGGAYTDQPHIYISRTGNTDFKNKVLREAYVMKSKPGTLIGDQTYSGGHAGGGRYLVFRWHTHQPKYRLLISDAAPKGDVNNHIKYCDYEECGISKKEPHRFIQNYGRDKWMQIRKNGKLKTDTVADKSHYKKCMDCGKVVYDDHKWATYTSDMGSHSKRCLICDYIIDANHANFGKEKLPVDQDSHIIFCDSCGFMKKLPHEFGDLRFVLKADCERSIVRYTCKQCYYEAYIEEPGKGHDYDAHGICTDDKCLHPYEQPGVELLADSTDSVFVVKSFGHLYWIADYVNSRHGKINVRLDNDLIADDFIKHPWRPIGDTDSTAFRGTFDGGGHVVTMLQTEKPVAGCGYRGLFGCIAQGATVKNLTLSACKMRGWNYVGTLAGVNEGTIDGCHAVFSVISSIGSGMNLGGICGMNRGTISRCTTSKSVWVGGVRDYAGGICGSNEGGRLMDNVSEAICGSGSDAELPETAANH